MGLNGFTWGLLKGGNMGVSADMEGGVLLTILLLNSDTLINHLNII